MRNTLFRANIVLFFVLATVLLFVPAGVGPLRVRWPVWAALVLFVSFGSVVLLIGRLEKRIKEKVKSRLRDRAALDSDAFAETFYETQPAAGVIAGQVRDVLAANLRLNLEGLHPHDRLDDDLDADVTANPDLFLKLSRVFEVDIPTEPAQLIRHGREIVTFDDLVQYVASLRADGNVPSM